ERKKVLRIHISLIVIAILVFVAGICWMIINNSSQGTAFVFLIIFNLLLIFLVNNDSKKFEDKIKKILLPVTLKNIAGNKGEIFWTSSREDVLESDIYNKINSEINNNNNNISQADLDLFKQTNDNFSSVLFNKYCDYDDKFYGHYCNIMFNNIEFDEVEHHGRHSTTFIKGNVLEIPLNISYKNKLVIKDKKVFVSSLWESRILDKLKNINSNIIFNNPKLKIFTDNINGIEEVLTPDFIGFINSLPEKYTVAVAQGDLYIISNSKKDKFKMGSLYKKVDDIKQYDKFQRDLLEVLDIVEKASFLKFAKKIEEDEV
ncbi:MAG: hypothetical protein MJ180_06385, partial [Candidatus Gastranaerophilales bacterium]|nr:hypothetical protein [Candidatus Gastranaerophilales bacterium]